MLKKTLIFILVSSLSFLSSCNIFLKYPELPETVEIKGEKYIKAFDPGYLFTLLPDSMRDDVKIDGILYKFSKTDSYGFYRGIDQKTRTAAIYFPDDHFNEAKAYYSNAENYTYYCHIGNIYEINDQTRHKVPDMDAEKLDELCALDARVERHKFKRDKELDIITVDMPNGTMLNQVYFFRESNDGILSSGTVLLEFYEGRLVLLYAYIAGPPGKEKMSFAELPEDLQAYFLPIYQAIVSEQEGTEKNSD